MAELVVEKKSNKDPRNVHRNISFLNEFFSSELFGSTNGGIVCNGPQKLDTKKAFS